VDGSLFSIHTFVHILTPDRGFLAVSRVARMAAGASSSGAKGSAGARDSSSFGMGSVARRDCAYGQADLGNERSYGDEPKVCVILSSAIIRKTFCWRRITRYVMRAL
jgi:hypothetical protein